MSRRRTKWLEWIAMILSVVIFTIADAFANKTEHSGRGPASEPVTATGWVRFFIRHSAWAAPAIALLWAIYHFFVQAYYPDLPL